MDPRRIFREVSEEISKKFMHKFPIELDPNEGEMSEEISFQSDPERLKQVLIKLCDYLIDQNEKAPRLKLKYELVKSDEKQEKLMITIIDNNNQSQPSLKTFNFKFFGHLDNMLPRDLNTKGVNLSLAASAKLLSLMNPSQKSDQPIINIIYDSTSGFGFKFEIQNMSQNYFDVDLERITSENFGDCSEKIEPIAYYKYNRSSPTCKTSDELISSADQSKKNIRILYAEDDHINRIVMKRYLSAFTHIKLECVENGLEAVKMIDCENPLIDLIFMDCNMPILDGYQATQEIRAIGKKRGHSRIPIVAVTANVLHRDLEHCLEVGMDDYLTKPFTKEDIKRKIDRIF